MNSETTSTAEAIDAPAGQGQVASASVRYHGLDALRGFAMMLGIVLHAALSYFLADQGYGAFWPQDDQQSVLSRYVFDFIHSWRMPTFFLLAGFFAHLVLERRGTGYFIGDRLKRILLPLVVFGIIIAAILPSIWVTATSREFVFVNPLDIPAGELTIGHLWFIYHLVYLYAILMVARWVASLFDRPLGIGRVMLIAFVNRWHVPLILLLSVIAIGRFVENVEDYLLWPIGAFDFLYSLVPFVVGYALYKRREMVEELATVGSIIVLLGIGVAAFAAQELLGPVVFEDSEDAGLLGLVYTVVVATATVCFTFGLIGLFQRLFTAQSAWIRWVADSSYWVYIMHLPVVLLVAYSMFDLPWPAELKFLIVCAVTGGLGFGTYWVFVRYTPIGTVLNGKRVRGYIGRPAAGATVASPAAGGP